MAIARFGVCFGGAWAVISGLGIERKILGVVWGVGNFGKIFAGV